MEEVPLDAPVLGIARLFIKKEGVEAYQAVVDRYGSVIEQGTKPYKPFAAWRVDCEEGKYEYLVITGWEKEGDHAVFTQKTRQEYPEYAAVRENYEGMDVKHARDMET